VADTTILVIVVLTAIVWTVVPCWILGTLAVRRRRGEATSRTDVVAAGAALLTLIAAVCADAVLLLFPLPWTPALMLPTIPIVVVVVGLLLVWFRGPRSVGRRGGYTIVVLVMAGALFVTTVPLFGQSTWGCKSVCHLNCAVAQLKRLELRRARDCIMELPPYTECECGRGSVGGPDATLSQAARMSRSPGR
jgi:hypothetical protein